MRTRYVEIISVLLCFFMINHVSCQLLPAQNSTMTKLYDLVASNTSSNPWTNVKFGPNPCSWIGVSCSLDNSTVTGLKLAQFSLSNVDVLSVSCEIDSLESLDFSNNHFGGISDEFLSVCGKISGLKRLNFSRNKLVEFPVFKGFVGLEYLDFSHNEMSGKLLHELVGLKGLNLGFNSLSGSIPEEIANCVNLTMIDLGGNKLSGSIPERFGELLKLESLILSVNNLTGEIPNSLLKITTLSRFSAHQNKFVGEIPVGLTKHLKNLDLSFNELNGSIPVELLSPSNLETVDLSNNRLEGPISANLSPRLFRLRLGNNQLSGNIPSSFGKLNDLTYLELENNKLAGPVPPELGLCRSLALLNLGYNNLNGTLQEQLGKLTNLQVLNLQFNNLSGPIPTQITKLYRLQILYLSQNAFTGQIPSSISSLKSLSKLFLQGNKLSSSIPDTISNLNYLMELQLGNNHLSGVIKSLPRSLRIALNLSNNNFVGEIPKVLTRLFLLEVLDLSNNKFSGEIPESFTNLGTLTQLLLSNNQLSGTIPKFRPYFTIDTCGNKGLINITTPSPSLRVPKGKKNVLVGVVLIGAAAGVLAVATIVFISFYIFRRYYRVNNVHPSSGEEDLKLSYKDLLLATNEFSQINLLGEGRYGSVYKGVLQSVEHIVAVKVLNIEVRGASKSFLAECEMLRNIRHRNLIKIITACSSIDFKGNDFKALVLEFMTNGSVDDWLHPSPAYKGNERNFRLLQRLNISIDVALGVDYLHNHNHASIIHSDIKPSNILLDEDFVAHIGDFGLARFSFATTNDVNQAQMSSTGVRGTVGYIPPEYGMCGEISAEGDIYSYGILLLEIFTGKRPTDSSILIDGASSNLHDYVRNALPQRMMDIVDPRIVQGEHGSIVNQSYSRAVMEVCLASIFEVGILCSEETPQKRIDISVAIKLLNVVRDKLLRCRQ